MLYTPTQQILEIMILQRMFFSEMAKVASVRPIFKKNECEKIEN